MYFDGRSLELDRLVEFAHDVLDSVEDIMAKRLLFQDDSHIPECNLDVMDDNSNHESGYYFGLHDRDGWRKGRDQNDSMDTCIQAGRGIL